MKNNKLHLLEKWLKTKRYLSSNQKLGISYCKSIKKFFLRMYGFSELEINNFPQYVREEMRFDNTHCINICSGTNEEETLENALDIYSKIEKYNLSWNSLELQLAIIEG